MEKHVAKRKLKSSYYAKPQIEISEFVNKNETANKIFGKNKEHINMLPKFLSRVLNKMKEAYTKVDTNTIHKRHRMSKEKSKVESFKDKMKLRFAYQTITAILMSLFILLVNIFDITSIKQASIVQKVVSEFKTHHETTEIYDAVMVSVHSIGAILEPVIPNGLSDKTIQVFNTLITKNEDAKIQVYEENNEATTIEIYDESGIGTGVVTIDEASILKVIGEKESSISVEDVIKEKILLTGLDFVLPVNGYLTSRFGVREEIFAGVDPYHYGIDIANAEGSNICSSIDGVVIQAKYNQEAGNYIEVENNNIKTRYCHLKEFKVSMGDAVKAGDIIATMGNTGFSTGPHLHFEIMYNDVRIDPLVILQEKNQVGGLIEI